MTETMTGSMRLGRGGRPGPPAVKLAEPGSERRRVRLTRLVAAVLLMALSAIAGWLLWQAQGEPVEVWVAAETMRAGEILDRADLRVASVDADSQVGAILTDVDLVGRVVRIAVPRGAAITPGHLFGANDPVALGTAAEVGLVLAEGRAPQGLEPADIVRLLILDAQGELVEVVDSVPVLDVVRDGRSALVTVELAVEQVDPVLVAAARSRIAVAIVGRR